jgi:hypothetical protein
MIDSPARLALVVPDSIGPLVVMVVPVDDKINAVFLKDLLPNPSLRFDPSGRVTSE